MITFPRAMKALESFSYSYSDFWEFSKWQYVCLQYSCSCPSKMAVIQDDIMISAWASVSAHSQKPRLPGLDQ